MIATVGGIEFVAAYIMPCRCHVLLTKTGALMPVPLCEDGGFHATSGAFFDWHARPVCFMPSPPRVGVPRTLACSTRDLPAALELLGDVVREARVEGRLGFA